MHVQIIFEKEKEKPILYWLKVVKSGGGDMGKDMIKIHYVHVPNCQRIYFKHFFFLKRKKIAGFVVYLGVSCLSCDLGKVIITLF